VHYINILRKSSNKLKMCVVTLTKIFMGFLFVITNIILQCLYRKGYTLVQVLYKHELIQYWGFTKCCVNMY